jgi:hypothetical protein
MPNRYVNIYGLGICEYAGGFFAVSWLNFEVWLKFGLEAFARLRRGEGWILDFEVSVVPGSLLTSGERNRPILLSAGERRTLQFLPYARGSSITKRA